MGLLASSIKDEFASLGNFIRLIKRSGHTSMSESSWRVTKYDGLYFLLLSPCTTALVVGMLPGGLFAVWLAGGLACRLASRLAGWLAG
jgi:hypothetical protein